MPTPKKSPAKADRKPRPKKGDAAPDKFANAPRARIRDQYTFTAEERGALGSSLATLYAQREQELAHKADLMAQINAKTKGLDAQIKETANKITSGIEPREFECYVILHDPAKWRKSFYDVATKTLVRTEIMAPGEGAELPMNLPPSQKPLPTEKKKPEGKKERSTDGAGMTALADALNVAAVGQDLPRVAFDPDPTDEPKDIAKKFAKAAGRAGWPQVCIAILRDEVKKAEVAHTAIETLAAHIKSTAPTPPESSDTQVDAGE